MNNGKIKKIIHDIRSRLGVMQMVFDIKDVFPITDENKEIFENCKLGFEEMIRLVEDLSQDLGLSQPLLGKSLQPIQKRHDYIQTSPWVVVPGQNQVLVVDDDSEIRNTFLSQLEKRGKTVLTIEKGEDLLTHALDLKTVSMAIVDYQFENSALDGFDVVEYLRSQNVRQIHLCTGCYDDPDVIKRAQELGIVSIISKPIPAHVWDVL